MQNITVYVCVCVLVHMAVLCMYVYVYVCMMCVNTFIDSKLRHPNIVSFIGVVVQGEFTSMTSYINTDIHTHYINIHIHL